MDGPSVNALRTNVGKEEEFCVSSVTACRQNLIPLSSQCEKPVIELTA